MNQAQKYRAASKRFFEQSQTELAIGDFAQASEKLWGAAAQQVKAIAEDAGDAELNRLFKVALRLHTNFYEDNLAPDRVHEMATRVEEPIRRLKAIGEA